MKDLRFGCSTWYFQEYKLTDALRIIAEYGYSAAEVWMEHLWQDPASPEEIGALAAELGLSLSVHAASYDLNITSTNPGIREVSLRQIEESLQAAAGLGAALVVVHPGRLSASRGDVGQYWRLLEEACGILDGFAARSGLKIGIEGMEKRAKEMFVRPADVHRLMTAGWQHLGITVDLAHIQGVMEHERFFASIEDRWVFHAHLSDNSPLAAHLPLGRGSMDVDRALRALNAHYRGTVILEGYVRGMGPQIARANREFLREHGWM